MTVELATAIVTLIGVYLLIGLGVAFLFVSFFVGNFDPTAKGMVLRARILILPGVMLLWPLVLLMSVRRALMTVRKKGAPLR